MDDPNLMLEYERYNRLVRLTNARIASILVITLMPFGAILDWFVYPSFFLLFLALRLACSLAATLSWLILERFGQCDFASIFFHAWYVLPASSIALMIAFSEGACSPYYAGLNLIILAVCAVMKTSVKDSLLALGIIFSLYAAACVYHGNFSNGAMMFNSVYFLSLTSVIVLAGNYNYNRLRFKEFKLRTQLTESEKKLQESNVQLKALDEAKSRFFANISHELRTPLTLIIGPIEKLKETDFCKASSEISSLLNMMELNSMRLLKLINNLLDLIRSEGGQELADLRWVSPDQLLNGIIASVQFMAKQKGLNLEPHFHPFPDKIEIDVDKLEKITLNLLLNSVKFTPAGGTISASWNIKNSYLELEIQDTGIGIEAADLGKIFDRFWQANTSSTRKFQGVGIGLALVKELTSSMKGELKVESQVGNGTKFSLTFPVAVQKAMPVQSTTEIPDATDSYGEEWLSDVYHRAALFIEPTAFLLHRNNVPHNLSKNRPLVLVADDQPDMAQFICSQLEHDFQIMIATDGQYAIDLARQYHPSLIVLDMMMPEKDGVEVCRELKDLIQTQGLPILAVTARADEEAKINFLKNGAIDFLSKPFSSSELLTRCRNLVALSTASNQLSQKNSELAQINHQLKESELKMVQHAKMVSLGQMSAGLIHEINNPINYVSSAVHLLKRKLTETSTLSLIAEETLKDIEEGIRRVSTLISSLRTFSHTNPNLFEKVNLKQTIQQAIRLTDSATLGEVTIIESISEELTTWGSQIQLSQVFVNLLQNAVDACAEKGQPSEIRLSGCVKYNLNEIYISDTGTGMAQDILDRIFDPFFTTKKVGSGMGLGLSICHTILRAHQGDIQIESKLGEGSKFIIILPLAPNQGKDDDTNQRNTYELALRL